MEAAKAKLSDEEKARGVIASSAGNHAQGVGFAADKFDIAADIFVPSSAPEKKISALKKYKNVTLHLVEGSFDDAKAESLKFQKEKKAVFVPPFDHPNIIAGQGTIGWEIMHQLPDADVVIAAIGGGGLISGIGSGMTIRFGGAIDGIDVLSVVFAKRIGISIGTFVLIFNTILYVVCGIVIQSWILPLYSIVTYYVGSKTVDYIVEGFNRAKCAMIVTTKADKISDALSDNFGTSGTIVNAVGGYSKQQKEIVYFIINHFQINKLKKIVHEIDGNAFISLQEVSDIIKTQNT